MIVYRDIKNHNHREWAGLVYSDTYIRADDAAAKSLVEEVKFVLANAIRADSRDQSQAHSCPSPL